MSTFLNLNIDKPVYWKFLLKHILYTILWLCGLSILFFRVDLSLASILSEKFRWVINIMPFAFFAIVLIIMIMQKWYFNLALIFYPFLAIFWFFPKLILSKGKIYMFLHYISYVYGLFYRYKSFLGHLGLFLLTIILLLIIDSNGIRVFAISVFTYFYIRFIIRYIQHSFRPPQLFGSDFEQALVKYIESPEDKLSLIKTFENQKSDEKLSEEDKKIKRLKRLIMLNYVIEYLGHSLGGFKGKKAYVISWLYQLIGFLAISLTYFTFLNFELYILDNGNYIVSKTPTIFYFFYYTLKTLTFSNIDLIKPASNLSMIIEMISFLILGIFILVIVISIVFSLRLDRMSDNVKKATELCLMQNKLIAEHIQIQYNTDIQTVLKEFGNIRKSLGEVKKIIDRFF